MIINLLIFDLLLLGLNLLILDIGFPQSRHINLPPKALSAKSL